MNRASGGASEAAVALAADADIIDLHLDTMIPARLWGYDPLVRHSGAPFGGHFFGHADVPRLEEGGVSGAMWSITTWPFRTAAGRWRALQANLGQLRNLVGHSEGRLALATDKRGYDAARGAGAHAVLPAVQGGHALDAAEQLPEDLVRVTLVHLLDSSVGGSCSPMAGFGARGLTANGRRLVERLDEARVFVDLAHIHADAFDDALETHDRTLPLLVTHTGAAGVRPLFRNVTDEQIRAVADTGGVVGVMFERHYLRRPGGPRDSAMVVEHMEHVADVGGEGCVAVGSDHDGFIHPPADLAGADGWPRLVQHMLDRGWTEDRIRAALGGNFLRALGALRP